MIQESKKTSLPLDQRTYKQARLCVHCGLCLPVCPTYTDNGLEADSPRGRIYLMKALADGRIEPTEAVRRHLDLCLDCRACETACPSGVVYHELIEETRAILPPSPKRSAGRRLVDWASEHVLPYPRRVKWSLLPARVLQKIGVYRPIAALMSKLLGPSVAKMQQMLPGTGPLWERSLAEHYPATAKRPDGTTIKVGLLAGCVGSVLFQRTNRRTIAVLNHLGCDVFVPRQQVCCGALHHHGGNPDAAATFARRNVEAFADCDVLVNNIAGCGAMLKEYDHLLRDDPQWAQRAADLSEKTRDISQFIAELDSPKPPHRVERTVTYHDACHLAHGQNVTTQPRRLLAMIDGLKVVPLTESDMCCGAAGTYNLQQPEMAMRLAQRKIKHIHDTGASACVTGNVGCAMQIQSEAAKDGVPLQVVHPIDLLYEAYFGKQEA